MRCAYTGRMRELERNLLRLYRSATETDYALGVAWYPRAHAIVCEWANTYERPIANVACIVSALSPQCSWERNLIIADDVLADRAISVGGALPANVRKARRILEDRATVMMPYFPHGPKVNTFAANLAGNYDVATVDTHCIQAALNDVEATINLKWSRYNVFSQCYVNAASRVGLAPAHFQSVIWHVWKRLHPRVSKIQQRRQWHVIGELED